MHHRLTPSASRFLSNLPCELSKHTVSVVPSVVLNPVVPQVIQGHSAVIES